MPSQRRRCAITHTRSLARALLVAYAAAAATAAGAQAQFRASADVFRIQVSVRDADGNFVDDLTAADFAVRIRGQERSVVDAQAIDSSRLAAPNLDLARAAETPGLELSAAETMSAATRRHFMLFFDLATATQNSLRNGRSAARDFVKERVQPGDLIGLTIYSPVTGVQHVVPFTTDHRIVDRALEELSPSRASERTEDVGEGLSLEQLARLEQTLSGGSESAAMIREIEQIRVELAGENLLEGIGRVIDTMAAIQGHKHLLMMSRGIPDALVEGDNTGTGIRTSMAIAVERARRADVAIHAFQPDTMPTAGTHDLRELTPDSSTTTGRFHVIVDRSALEYFAAGTGGSTTYFRHTLRRGMQELEQTTRLYYVLTLPLHDDDPAVIDLDLNIRRPGVEVRWAPTRVTLPGAIDQLSPAQLQLQIAEALALGNDSSDIRMNFQAVVLDQPDARARVAIVWRIDSEQIRALLNEGDGEGLTFEVLGMAVDADSQVQDHFRSRAALQDPARLLEDPGDVGFRYYNLFIVPPGSHYLKLVVRESHSGKLVSRSVRLDVPAEPDPALRLSPPVLLRTAAADLTPVFRGANPSRPPQHRIGMPLDYPFRVADFEYELDGGGELVAGRPASFFLLANSVAGHPFTGRNQTTLELGLALPDGSVTRLDGTIRRSEYLHAAGQLRMLVEVTPDATLAPGPYRLVAWLQDAVRDEAVTSILDVVLLPTGSRGQP